MEVVGSAPPVLIDAAHNPAAVAAVLPEIGRRLDGRAGVLLFGSMSDHNHHGMLELLQRLDFRSAVFTRSSSDRAAPAAALAAEWPRAAEAIEPVPVALARAQALAGPNGLVVSLGSIYVIGEVMAALGVGLPPDPEVPYAPLW
jgi:dihydrofolate synthase/folylpolyglutamate synthase